MRDRLAHLWETVRTSLWPIPSLMAIAACGLSWWAVRIDRSGATGDLVQLAWYYGGGAEEARSLVSTVAASMITVASLAFSVTMVALTIAANQLGPRLLRNFLRDTANQVVLGAFVATFLYCLLVLQTIEGRDGDAFVPHLAVTLAFLLAVIDVGLLIYFIHHAATSIYANNVLAAVAAELDEAIDHLYPSEFGCEQSTKEGEEEHGRMPPEMEEDARQVDCRQAGYIQTIDQEGMLRLARSRDLVIRLLRRPGHFVAAGTPIATVHPAGRADGELEQRLNANILVGRVRTPTQDVEFAVDQLVEVGIRALSPGINDNFTAIATIDWLGAALSELASKPTPSKYRYDSSGTLRVVANIASFNGILDGALHQLRQSARDKPAPLLRLLEILEQIAARTTDRERRAALRRHADMLERAATEAVPEAADRKDIADRYRRVLKLLAEPDPDLADAARRMPADALAPAATRPR